jgi:hypothetical protein
MKRRKFIVLVDGAAAASQDGSIASVYLRAVTQLTERSTGTSCYLRAANRRSRDRW